MNWGDERYVKLYVRDTYTWRKWPWQARALLGPFLKALNGAGFVDLGNDEPAEALAMMVLIPVEVVRPALEAWLADGTVERVAHGLLMPKFLEAQEATKTPAQKKRDQRDRDRALIRAQQAGILGALVTGSHPQSPPVPLQPSPPPPPAQPKIARPAKKPPDPRHRVVVEALVAASPGYAFTGRDARAVTELLALADEVEIAQRWMRALRRDGYPRVRTIPELVKHWNHFASEHPPMPGKGPVDPATQRHTGGEIAL